MNEIATSTVDSALTQLQSGATSTLGKCAGVLAYIVVACLVIWGIVFCYRQYRYWMG